MFRLFNRRKPARRVLVLGLDCASPHLLFQQFTDDLPHLRRLMQGGTYGVLQSSIPCITVPAWSSMLSSRDAGVLGVYGFRNRADYSYDALTIADNRALQHPRLWDILAEQDKQSLILNVPQTYPVRPMAGHLVSGFLTPGTGAQFAYPAIFKQEVLKHMPDYAFDVRDFRHIDRAQLYQRIIDVTDVQYQLLEHALTHKAWDFAMHVNIGVDRIHHAYWRYHDPEHRLHDPDSPYRHAIRDYYKRVDTWIGRILNVIDDQTAVLVVSDHGAKRMDGAIAINQWLYDAGWLSLKQTPPRVTAFSHEMVDWAHTRAWSTGGYYGRIFLNVCGREPQGIIAPEDYEAVRDDLAAQLRAIPDDTGTPLPDTQVFKPQAIYRQVNNIAPDLMVYFGDLHWRVVGSVGYEQHYTLENDTGPDDANHAEEGVYILYDPRQAGRGAGETRHLMDIAPTVLNLMNCPIPADMQGASLI